MKQLLGYKIGELFLSNSAEDYSQRVDLERGADQLIPEYSLEEVEIHNSLSECWIVMHQYEVFDVTRFINDHPGGAEQLDEHCGTDATHAFSSAGFSDDGLRLL